MLRIGSWSTLEFQPLHMDSCRRREWTKERSLQGRQPGRNRNLSHLAQSICLVTSKVRKCSWQQWGGWAPLIPLYYLCMILSNISMMYYICFYVNNRGPGAFISEEVYQAWENSPTIRAYTGDITWSAGDLKWSKYVQLTTLRNSQRIM